MSKKAEEGELAKIAYFRILSLLTKHPEIAKKLPARFWELLKRMEAKVFE